MALSQQALVLNQKEMLSASISFRNELLKELFCVPSIANHLLPHLKIVPLAPNQVLYECGDQVDYLYFPLDAVVSGLTIIEDGTTIETAMIGREGLVGMSTILGYGRTRHWFWVTIGGHAMRLEAGLVDSLFIENERALKALLGRYRSLITQVSQRCVCNTRHTILERLCCWFLMIHDRVGSADLCLTQEMIASRVGARRAGITAAAGVLQQMNALAYRRGHIHIQNRETLASAVCECYNVMQADFSRIAITRFHET